MINDLTQDSLNDLLRLCEINKCASLGDTLKEKYESIYLKMIRLSVEAYRKNGSTGFNGLITSPELMALFESVCPRFAPTGFCDQHKDGDQDGPVMYHGVLNQRYRMYETPMMPKNQILLCCVKDNKAVTEDPDFLALLEVDIDNL